MPADYKNIVLNRRGFIKSSALLSAQLLTSNALSSNLSIKEIASKKGINYGSAISLNNIVPPSDFEKAVINECSIVVPGSEMKWGVTEYVKGRPNYSKADLIANFAERNNILLRGHTALWYRNTPKWTNDELLGSRASDVILKRVNDVVSYFKGRVFEWDIVNESISPKDNLPGNMRDWPPFAKGDPGYIADSFHAASSADKGCFLYYNDYGFEYNNEDNEKRRRALLSLLEELNKRNAPISGFGTQSHLKVGENFSPNIYRKFLKDVASFGLRISITELDVNDSNLPEDISSRDAAIADHASQFLDVALDEHAVKSVLTWGISDRHTWLNNRKVRKDGIMQRPLPLDINFSRKPLWFAIAKSFVDAPAR